MGKQLKDNDFSKVEDGRPCRTVSDYLARTPDHQSLEQLAADRPENWPLRKRPLSHLFGPYAAELKPLDAARFSDGLPELMEVGLAMRLPKPGEPILEAIGPEYRRVPVRFVELSPFFWVASTEVVICPLVSAFDRPTHVVLFDADGTVIAQGVLKGRTRGAGLPSSFDFPSPRLRLRRPRPSHAR